MRFALSFRERAGSPASHPSLKNTHTCRTRAESVLLTSDSRSP